MTKFPSLKCPICGKTYKEVGTFGNHMRNEHPGTIPEGWSDLRYAYFVHTGKSHGKCRECGNDTPWNEVTGAYLKICTKEECRKKVRERFCAGMRARYGKQRILDDPAYRERMLAGRRISGQYEFRDGGKVGYMGTLEKQFLIMLDTFFNFPSNDILSPSPNRYEYQYTNENDREHEGTHMYIPDFYIPSCNLEIELKTSDNQRPNNLLVGVVKDACKDIMMIRNPMVNYCKIYEDNYDAFFQIFSDLANQNLTGERRPIKYISRALVTSIYRDYIPDDCLKVIDRYIYKYSKPISRKKAAIESEMVDFLDMIDNDEPQDTEIVPENMSVEDYYGEGVDTSDEDDEFDGVGVNPMMYYMMGDYANQTPLEASESLTFDMFNLDEDSPAMEGLFDTIDTSKIDGRAAIRYSRWRDKLFGGKLLGKTSAKAFSKVTIENENIVIRGINCNLLLYRIKENYGEVRLKHIFEYQYNARSWKLYQKKKIGRGDMKIDYVYAPQFFCLELVDMFTQLADKYHDASYRRIAELIYEASWLSKADNIEMPPLSTEPLNAIRLELMPHQIQFIEKWPQLKAQLNMHGYILAFKPGKGKTLTAIGLAECIKAKHVYIVCPNNLKDNWALEIKKYYAKYDDEKQWMKDVCILGTKYGNPDTARFIITNNENIKLMMPVAKNDPDSMVILDECHNFRNFAGGRSKELFDLCDKIDSHNVLCVSATPIKAAPSEITPVLRIIDPTFNDQAAAMYAKCFELNDVMAMSLVTKRFGKIMYRPADAEVDLPEIRYNDLFFTVPNEERYYLDNVHDEIIEDFKARQEQWIKDHSKDIDQFQKDIYKWSICDRRTANGYISWVISSSQSLRGGDNTDFHELSIKEYRSFIDNYIRTNTKCPSTEVDRLTKLQDGFIIAAKSNMGKAVGKILPPRRVEMFKALFHENRTTIFEMIRNRPKKTVIFSTMVPVVKQIVSDLNDIGIGCVSITGETKNRLEVLNQFRDDPNTLVLVATSWCMGVGVTLTEASQMFFFGAPWRSTDFEQAALRIHRIGQTDEVDIWTGRLKSKKHNLSDRMQDILEWSGKMFGTAITSYDLDGTPPPDATPAVEMYVNLNKYQVIRTMHENLTTNYTYGLPRNGKIVTQFTDEEFDREYRTLNPGQFTKHHGGVCFDYMVYQDFYLRSFGLHPEEFFINFREINQTHAFSLIQDGERWIYPEAAFQKIKGIYVGESLNEIVSFIVNTMMDATGKRINKPTVDFIRVTPYYGRHGEDLPTFFHRVYKQGTTLKFKYDRTVHSLPQMTDEYCMGFESFNMRVDSNQYEVISEGEMTLLQRVKEVCSWMDHNRYCSDIIYDHEGMMKHLAVQNMRDDGINNFCKNGWECLYFAHRQLTEHMSNVRLLIKIEYEDQVIYHPVMAIPFKSGALVIEYAIAPKENGLYFTTDLNKMVSALAKSMVAARNRHINGPMSELKYDAFKNVKISVREIPNAFLTDLDLSELTIGNAIEYIEANGAFMKIDYDYRCDKMHEVEVLDYGWSISRW